MALCHFHGFIDQGALPRSMAFFGQDRLPLPCGSVQSALLTVQVRSLSFLLSSSSPPLFICIRCSNKKGSVYFVPRSMAFFGQDRLPLPCGSVQSALLTVQVQRFPLIPPESQSAASSSSVLSSMANLWRRLMGGRRPQPDSPRRFPCRGEGLIPRADVVSRPLCGG
jgi:hypothetical protein